MPNRILRVDLERKVLRAVNHTYPSANPLNGLSKHAINTWRKLNGTLHSDHCARVTSIVGELGGIICAAFDESGQAILDKPELAMTKVDGLLALIETVAPTTH